MGNNLLLKRIRELTRPISPISTNHKTKLKTLEDIRCVAFDFYGTMFISDVGDIGIDSEQQQNNIYFAEALQSAGFTILNGNAARKGITRFEKAVKTYTATAKNQGIDYPEPDIRSIWTEVLRSLKQEKIITGNLTEQSAEHFGVEFEFRINEVWPTPNLEEVLHILLKHDLKLGIISNSQFYTPIAFEALLDKSPEKFGFDPNLLVWSYKAGRKKPSEKFYRLFMNAAIKKNLNSADILYVGNDIRKDVRPAKALGMRTALYVGDKRSIRHEPEELEKDEYKPDLIIDDLNQITECLSF